jgi:hypothetical protein
MTFAAENVLAPANKFPAEWQNAMLPTGKRTQIAECATNVRLGRNPQKAIIPTGSLARHRSRAAEQDWSGGNDHHERNITEDTSQSSPFSR